MWTYSEPCVGSGALALHLMGAKTPIMAFQGGKWRFRNELESIIRRHGFEGPPRGVCFDDVGYWGGLMRRLSQEGWRGKEWFDETILHLEYMAVRDPKQVYDELNRSRIPNRTALADARFLFLQRLSFGGKAVGSAGGIYRPQGFNKTSAYGIKKSESFGGLKPQIPSLIKRMNALQSLTDGHRFQMNPDQGGADVVYIDPPYRGTTGYPDGTMSREHVVSKALWAKFSGSKLVMVSESEPIEELEHFGWKTEYINDPGNGDAPIRHKGPEWVTYWAEQ